MNTLLQVYDRDLTIVSGKGARLTDSQGRTYLDFAAGIGVNGLGHCDRKVVAAIRKQAGRLIHSSNLYYNDVIAQVAQKLVALSFPSRVFFCNSGTEAVEGAIKFARRIGHAQGRTELLAFEGSFHGRTLGALSLTWTAKYREPFEPLLPGVRFLRWNDLEAAEAAIGPRTAAVVIEPIQGEGGVRPAEAAFLQSLARLCQERSALLVLDEVQCGLGRTGRMFAYQHAGIRPDVLTLAKPLGGGLPLGAVLLREDLAPLISVGDHGSTFGGNPVAGAAALEVLGRLSAEGFLEKIVKKGSFLRKSLLKLARKHPQALAGVRGLGLMVGVEFGGPVAPVLRGLRERGVLATKCGEHVLRLLPPLVVKRREIQEAMDVLDLVLRDGAGAVDRRKEMKEVGGATA
ncbi:MAG TPA: aspartate aminotransferase family protein [Vicinamibacteria bacterium]|jgi:predicted acetylornithine/succinylornithine family transaminase|nr:aspartate aminotransferase family protein [Vicinamibacteria bacterium]